MDLGFDLNYYVALLRRRFLYICIPFVLVFGVSTTVAFMLPSVFRSTGKILVESQQIPDELVRSTVTGYAGERIEIIRQRVMTRENIFRIVDTFGLFAGERDQMSATEIVDAVHDAIMVEPVNAELLGLHRPGKATIAFTVSFEHERPDIAVRVANELVTLFLNENIRTRTARASETTDFLRQEAARLKKQVGAIEDQIAKYKEQYGNALPEHLELRIATLERTKTNLRETKREIKAIEAEKRFLDIQLAAARSGLAAGANGLTTGYGGQILTPEQELQRLQMDLLEKSAVYDQSHPDMAALKRKISAMSQRYEVEAERTTLELRIRELKIQLEESRSRYSEKHPDIRHINGDIAKTKEQLAALPTPAVERTSANSGAVADPVYANVQAQIEIAEGRIASLKSQQRLLEERITELEASIIQTPQVERSLKALNRDYQNAVRKYDEIRAKEMEAQLAENLEEDKKAERFTLLEPPVFPDAPVKPNRHKMIAFGLALAAAAAGGGLLFIEAIDGSIRGAAGYKAMLKHSPLVTIPYIATTRELRQRRRVVIGALLTLLTVIIAAVVALHLFFKPLDVLFLKVLQMLQ